MIRGYRDVYNGIQNTCRTNHRQLLFRRHMNDDSKYYLHTVSHKRKLNEKQIRPDPTWTYDKCNFQNQASAWQYFSTWFLLVSGVRPYCTYIILDVYISFFVLYKFHETACFLEKKGIEYILIRIKNKKILLNWIYS